MAIDGDKPKLVKFMNFACIGCRQKMSDMRWIKASAENANMFLLHFLHKWRQLHNLVSPGVEELSASRLDSIATPSITIPAMQRLPNMQAEKRLKIQTFTFGCKVNRADTVALESLFRPTCSVAEQGEVPDIVVVNTCTVTEQADRHARQLIRRVHREHPKARIVVTGCSVEADPSKFSRIDGVELVVPIEEQKTIPEKLGLQVLDGKDIGPIEKFSGLTRAFLKLQNGCNAYCSFCVLPYVRGRSYSLSLKELKTQLLTYKANGYREVVLTGTHIGAYGRDLTPRTRFSDVLRQLIDAVPNIQFRISSLEPTTLTPDVIRVIREYPQIRPHFHIPLQSGSQSVLKRMNRKYKIENYIQRVSDLSRVREHVSIGTDVIVGFPGETDEEFEETRKLLLSLPITYLHSFRYSPRPKTKSYELKDDVLGNVKRDRMSELKKIDLEMRENFYKKFFGTEQRVLVETKRDPEGRLTGYTPHYVPMRFDGPDRLMEKEVDVRLVKMKGDAVIGEVA